MIDYAMHAEHLAEMAADAETKKEANEYWKQYRQVMIAMTGDKNLFRRPVSHTNRPTRAFTRKLKVCTCSGSGLTWSRQWRKYERLCGHEPGSSSGISDGNGKIKWSCYCGVDSGFQHIGFEVRIWCESCGKTTAWHTTNIAARNEWNEMVDGLIKK